jgi:hypothetical protein
MLFGPMCCTPVFSVEPEDWGLDRAVARLLERTDCSLDGKVEHPQVVRWIQLPRILLVLQVAPDDPESGEIFMYDRRAGTWFRIDFEDQNFGGYSAAQFELLVKRPPFLRLLERPWLLDCGGQWSVQPGSPLRCRFGEI